MISNINRKIKNLRPYSGTGLSSSDNRKLAALTPVITFVGVGFVGIM